MITAKVVSTPKSHIKLKIAIVALAVLLLAGAVLVPIGPVGCKGIDCFGIGPLARSVTSPPGGAPRQASAQVLMLFPGTVTYSDGSSAALTSQQTTFTTLTGPSGKPVSKIAVQIVAQINYNVTAGPLAPMTVSVSGYIDEVGSRPSSTGAFYSRYSHLVLSSKQTVSSASTSVSLFSANRTVTDFSSMSDLSASKNSTFFNYAMVGSLNLSFGTPLNRTVSAVFAWPNSQISLNNPGGLPPPPPPPSGGGGPCTRSACPVTVANPLGVKYNWFAIGTAPTFTVVDAQSSRSILQILGLV